jgi:hypothetical protein
VWLDRARANTNNTAGAHHIEQGRSESRRAAASHLDPFADDFLRWTFWST